MEKHLYIIVSLFRWAGSTEWKTEHMEIEASGQVDAKFIFQLEMGIGVAYILAVYGPYERISDEQ